MQCLIVYIFIRTRFILNEFINRSREPVWFNLNPSLTTFSVLVLQTTPRVKSACGLVSVLVVGVNAVLSCSTVSMVILWTSPEVIRFFSGLTTKSKVKHLVVRTGVGKRLGHCSTRICGACSGRHPTKSLFTQQHHHPLCHLMAVWKFGCA